MKQKRKRRKMYHRRVKKTTKGALIKGMSKRLPSEILIHPVFKQRLREIMKGYSGIYALYNRKRPYYVGLTKDLSGRVKAHQRDRHANKWDSFVVFRIKRIDYLKDIETLITHLVELPGNRVKGRIQRDGDINRILREMLTQHSKEMEKIRRVLRRG